MLKYFFIFQLLYSTLPFHSSIIQSSILNGNDLNSQSDQIIHYAQQYRSNPTLTQEQDQERLKLILEKLNDILPHYQIEDNLKSTIQEFLKDHLSLENIDVSHYNVIDSRSTDFHGKSQDEVFFIQDNHHQTKYIVKAFQNPSHPTGKFLPEISAMDLIQNMNLPGIVPIKGLAFALFHQGDKDWGILLESVAPGNRLDQYFITLSKETHNLEEKNRIWQVAMKALHRFGESLAALHSIQSPEKGTLSASILEKYDKNLVKVIKDSFITNELSKHLSFSRLVQFVQDVKREALQVKLFYTYAHRDPNLGNVFYDETLDAISFIDLYALHQSVDVYGQPISDPVIDLVRAEASIRKKSADFLTNEEINSLVAFFYHGYEQNGGVIPDEQHFRFYKTYNSFWRLILSTKYTNEKDPEKREFNKASFEEGLEYLQKQLSK